MPPLPAYTAFGGGLLFSMIASLISPGPRRSMGLYKERDTRPVYFNVTRRAKFEDTTSTLAVVIRNSFAGLAAFEFVSI
jgi:hypothetical protein